VKLAYNLQLEKIFFQVEACDFRVQQRIAEQLIITAKDELCIACSKNAAFQSSLCYSFGFGVPADSDQCQNWLEKSGKSAEDLKIQLGVLRDMIPRAEATRQLVKLGVQTNLVNEYRERGVLQEAVVAYKAMAAGREQAFGITHFSTRRVRVFLGYFLKYSGHPEDAIKMRGEDLELALRELGQDDQDIFALKCSQATAYEDIGNFDKAKELAQEVLNSESSEAGIFRLQALSSLTSIALEEGRLAEAIERGIAAVEEGKRLFGMAHDRTLFAKSALAAAYGRSGNREKAIEINEEVAQIRKMHLGPNHTATIESLDRLGLQYSRLGNNAKASNLFKQVWESRQELLGNTAVATLRSAMNYAAVLPSLGRADEGATILEDVLADTNNETDTTRTNLAMSIKGNLAVAYQFQRKYPQAEILEREVLAFNRAEYGNGHDTTLISMRNLSDTLFNQRKWDEAYDLSVEEAMIRKTISDEPDDAKIVAISKAIASLVKLKRWKDAPSLINQEFEWRRHMMKMPEVEFQSRQSFMDSLALAATVSVNLQRLDEARHHIAEFLEGGDREGPLRPSIIGTIENLAVLCDGNGFLEEAEQLYVLELLIRQDFYPDEKKALRDMIKRVLEIKEKLGTTGSAIKFEPSALIKRAREAQSMHSGLERLKLLDDSITEGAERG
jgi:tetratricopeptide (TPR) repeat protein